MKSLDEYLQKELDENKETFEENLLYRLNPMRRSLSKPSQEELIEELHKIYSRLERIKEFPHCFITNITGKPYISPQTHLSIQLGYVYLSEQGFELTQKGEDKLNSYRSFLDESSIHYH